MTGDHRDDQPLPLGEGTVRMQRPSTSESHSAPPSSDASFDSESTTRRMVRDEALDAALAGIDEDIPGLAMTGKMPAKIERRALPFQRRQEGARQVDQPSVAPFTEAQSSPGADAWTQVAPPAAPSFDVAQLPSALMPTSEPAPPVREAEDEGSGGMNGALVALGVFVALAVVLVVVALFAV